MQSYRCIPTREKRKQRISHSIWSVHFDIDIYRGIPPLLEIEAGSKKEIFTWIERLGLEKKTTASYGSRSLFKAYKVPYTTLEQQH
jgi:adenylate cyclase class IV